MKSPWNSRDKRKQDLDAEIQSHLEMSARDGEARGEPADQAAASARRELGNPGLIRDVTHDQWQWNWLEALAQDVQHALRMLRRSPGFTLVAILVLALGIGATTAIFSVINAVLIRPLPYKDPSRLVAISSLYHQGGAVHTYPIVSLNQVEEWRRDARSLDAIGSFVFSALPVSVGRQSMFLVAIGADPELLATLGASPAMGANFSGTGSTRKDPSVIISHRLWVEAFHSDPETVGRAMQIDGELFTVVGVLSANFQFPRSEISFSPDAPDIILPIANMADMYGRDSAQWIAIGRLKSGVNVAQAESELLAIDSRLSEKDASLRGMQVHVTRLDAETRSNVRPALLLMLGISVVLLLIACTNVMNLLFSRGVARDREIALRKAVGASIGRLVRQMLTESACLTFFAGIVGVVLASVVLDALVSLSPAHLPVSGRIGIDFTVLGFAILVCSFAAVVAGLFPALYGCRQSENPIHAGTRTSGSRTLARFQRVLMVTQIALGVGLLAAAGLLAHSLHRLSSVDPGFRTAGVLGFELAVPSKHSDDATASDLHTAHTRQLYQRMLEDTRSIPGVLSAGWITNLPPETISGMFMPFFIAGSPTKESNSAFCNFQSASEEYFQTVGVPIVRGRDFTPADGPATPPVAIVNETLARQYFPAGDALGKFIVPQFDSKDAPRQIVGIIRDTHDRGLDTKPYATAYIPYQQLTLAYGAIVVRTDLPPETVFPEIRRRVAQIDPTVPLKNFTTINARIHRTLDEPRFYTLMAGACALMAVLFVTLGLYGVVAFSVARRTPEIGIRMALGAPQSAILRGVLWQGLHVAALGVAIGLALALAATRLLATLLFEIKPNDPATLAMAAALVGVVTLAACYIPARRASRVDPMIALRYE
ncbi:MAG TPA: ABC transporter permease [Candidatus Sulfotelmatobacter sp.]|nr:ABC transporter permease [Candidatus Sulfotelmatobacter sp.]